MFFVIRKIIYLGLGGSQVSGGSLGGGHDFVELGLVPSIGVLKGRKERKIYENKRNENEEKKKREENNSGRSISQKIAYMIGRFIKWFD